MCHLYLRARTERNGYGTFHGGMAKVLGCFGPAGDRTAVWRVSAQTGFGMSANTWRTPKRSATRSPRRLMPKVSVA